MTFSFLASRWGRTATKKEKAEGDKPDVTMDKSTPAPSPDIVISDTMVVKIDEADAGEASLAAPPDSATVVRPVKIATRADV